MVGICGTEEESDVLVKVSLGGDEIVVNLTSRNKILFGRHIEKAVKESCKALNINGAVVEVKDFGALDFVIRARTKTAIKDALREVEL